MPSFISLKDFNRELKHIDDKELLHNMDYLQVSLKYMIAYLNVLIVEFEQHYLKISNLQNYQDVLENKIRTLYAESADDDEDSLVSLENKIAFLENAKKLFDEDQVPSNIEVV